MKLLFITPNPPSPQRIRPYGFLHALSRRGHALTIAAPCTSTAEAAALSRWSEIGATPLGVTLTPVRRLLNIMLTTLQGRPLQAGYAWHPGLAAALGAAVNAAAASGASFDVAHVEHLRGSSYGLALEGRLPVVWDSVDCISALFADAARHSASARGRWMARLELGRTRRYEAWLPNQFRHTVVTSAVDQAALQDLAGPEAAISVVPNGVDLDYFQPPVFQPPVAARDPATILFSGRLGYHANVTAACFLVREVMPPVWAAHPEARVVLAGADPAPEVRALAARPDGASGGVEVTGTVPDLRPYLARATVAVAPVVYGAGIQNKVLEAMAMGAPVVTTPIALRALAPEAASACRVAGDAAGLALEILGLLDDPARAADLGVRGRDFVAKTYSWDAAASELESIYEKSRFNRRVNLRD